MIAQITFSGVVLEALCHGQIIEGEEQGETLRMLILESAPFPVQIPAEIPIPITNVPSVRLFGVLSTESPQYFLGLMPVTSEDLTVTFTNSNGTVTCDTQFLDIKNAISAGKIVHGLYVYGATSIYPLAMSLQGSNKVVGSYADFSVIEADPGILIHTAITLQTSNYGTVTVNERFPVA